MCYSQDISATTQTGEVSQSPLPSGERNPNNPHQLPPPSLRQKRKRSDPPSTNHVEKRLRDETTTPDKTDRESSNQGSPSSFNSPDSAVPDPALLEPSLSDPIAPEEIDDVDSGYDADDEQPAPQPRSSLDIFERDQAANSPSHGSTSAPTDPYPTPTPLHRLVRMGTNQRAESPDATNTTESTVFLEEISNHRQLQRSQAASRRPAQRLYRTQCSNGYSTPVRRRPRPLRTPNRRRRMGVQRRSRRRPIPSISTYNATWTATHETIVITLDFSPGLPPGCLSGSEWHSDSESDNESDAATNGDAGTDGDRDSLSDNSNSLTSDDISDISDMSD
jgi:hypothetical protein